MKTAWSITSSFAVIMLLFSVVAFSWMWFSGRMDADRLSELRDVLLNRTVEISDTVDAPGGEAQSGPPGSSSRLLESRGGMARSLTVSRQGLQQEATIRQRQIELALDQLAQAKEDLALERAAFRSAQEAASQEVQGRDPKSQFRRSIQLMESAQPIQAKVWLLTMVEDGRFDDAVATLDSMRERSASRILREFKSAGELELAGQLLEALGRYGTIPEEPPPLEASQRVSYGIDTTDSP